MAKDRLQTFARPETVMRSHLDPEEIKLYDDARADKSLNPKINWSAPSKAAYLAKNWLIPLVIAGLFIAALVLLLLLRNAAGRLMSGALLVIIAAMLVTLEVRLWLRTYTRYIVTNDRVIRMEGIVTRSQSSIPLRAITDVSDKVGLVGQFLGYGDITIETANEASKFKELTEVPEPHVFLDWLEYARSQQVKPPKPTPANENALLALGSLAKLITDGGLVVERSPTGSGWRLKGPDPTPPPAASGH